MGRESLLIASFASGADHPHRSGAGSVLSRLIRLMAKRTQGWLCGQCHSCRRAPCQHASTWVFDDPRVGLFQEPFVSGIPETIDTIIDKL